MAKTQNGGIGDAEVGAMEAVDPEESVEEGGEPGESQKQPVTEDVFTAMDVIDKTAVKPADDHFIFGEGADFADSNGKQVFTATVTAAEGYRIDDEKLLYASAKWVKSADDDGNGDAVDTISLTDTDGVYTLTFTLEDLTQACLLLQRLSIVLVIQS